MISINVSNVETKKITLIEAIKSVANRYSYSMIKSDTFIHLQSELDYLNEIYKDELYALGKPCKLAYLENGDRSYTICPIALDIEQTDLSNKIWEGYITWK